MKEHNRFSSNEMNRENLLRQSHEERKKNFSPYSTPVNNNLQGFLFANYKMNPFDFLLKILLISLRNFSLLR